MTAYYNEIDPFAAQWLRELIKHGHIADGVVDTRSIEDVTPNDLKPFTQCHFFAGIGVWSHALRSAGWSDDIPVWTGSCPCQPFSSAGKGAGFADERHLWPVFHWLIDQCRPDIVFGEQVAGKAGEVWFDVVRTDLEGSGYASGLSVFPACGVGAPHQRKRLYWVANAQGVGLEGGRCENSGGSAAGVRAGSDGPGCGGIPGGLANPGSQGLPPCECRELSAADGHDQGRAAEQCSIPLAEREPIPGPTNGFWGAADWLFCRDGKWRAVEPGSQPLADGSPARVVFTCACCEARIVGEHETLHVLRHPTKRHEGLEAEKVLFQILHGRVDGSQVRQGWPEEGAVHHPADGRVRAMWGDEQPGEAPQRSGCDKQQYGEPGGSVPVMSPQGACGTVHERVQGLWKDIQGASEAKQNMFCPVCQGMGPHLCKQEVVKNRVGRLRGYGNAIVSEQAKAFIEAVMDVC